MFLTMSVKAAPLRLEETMENIKMRTIMHRCVALGVLGLVGSLGCAGSTGTGEEQADTEQAGAEHVGAESSALSSLDTTFNGTGKVEVLTQGGENYRDVKIDGSGRLVATGVIMHNAQSTPPSGMNLKVARMLSNGKMDTTFASSGVFSYKMNDESIAYSSAIMPNGNILVAGQASVYATPTTPSRHKAFVLQLDSTGHLVTTFGTNGIVRLSIGKYDDSANDVVVQPDGKILLAGYTKAFGSPPGPNQYSTTEYPVVVRLLSTGALDTSFGSGGVAKGKGLVWDVDGNSYNHYSRLILQANGSIIGVGIHGTGTTVDAGLMERFTSAGVVDTTFGTNGRVVEFSQGEYHQATALSNGNIVAVGERSCGASCRNTVVAQYTSAGSLVSTFGSGGRATFSASGDPMDGATVAVQADGKILVGGKYGAWMGQAYGVVLRLLPNGARDTSFGTSGHSPTLDGPVESLAVQSDGKIVGAGMAVLDFNTRKNASAVYRLNP
jgi:uncharacterized delta-60 repeat protein